MIIDVGSGTSKIAVIALNGIVDDISIRVGGDELNDAIIMYLKKNYNLLIGELTAEDIKIKIELDFPPRCTLLRKRSTRMCRRKYPPAFLSAKLN